MKSKLLAGLVLAGGSLFAGPHVSVGVGFGPVAPAYVQPVAPAYVEPAHVPPRPGPDYIFIDGDWQHRRPVAEHRHRDDRHDNFRRDLHRR